VRFEWDERKNRLNWKRHKIRFETALLVFDDPHAVTIRDRLHDEQEERFITLGRVGNQVVLFVVHTGFEEAGEEVLRIIFARKATAYEKKIYEASYSGTT
jgi:uncharacterized protein